MKPDSTLAARIRRLKGAVATQVTDEFLARHPDWVERYGEGARRHGEADAGYHVDFLAGAILAGSTQAFEDYARWTARVLEARGMAPVFLEENLRQVGRALGKLLGDDGADVVHGLVDAGCRACLNPEPAGPAPQGGIAAESVGVYVSAAMRGDRRAARVVVDEALSRGMPFDAVYAELLQEAQYELGRLWESGRITVAEEHTATAVTQYVLAGLYDRLPRPAERRGRAVVTGVGGELHSLGAQMVADALEMDGWEVRFLGTELPHAGVVEALKESDATLVAISAAMLFNLPQVEELVGRIRREMSGSSLRILVGGRAFHASPEAWRAVGADGEGRDMREAVRIARGAVEA